jgi:3-oxoacyl-[acyl-carrier-protein] synthase III
MSIEIKSAAWVQDDQNISSLHLGATAARQALEISDTSDEEIGLLINIGTYRDENLVEPAEAALMQQRAGLNGDMRREVETADGSLAFEPAPTTLSFDVLGGACGFFNALEILDSFTANGTVSAGLIISANVHPSKTDHPDFPFTPLGSAMVVSNSQAGLGFGRIKGYNSKDNTEPGITGSVCITKQKGDGRDVIEIKQSADLVDRLVSFTVENGRQYLAEHNLAADDFDYIVGVEHDADFLKQVAVGLGLDPELCQTNFSQMGNTHSSAPIIAFSDEQNKKPGRRGLVIGSGSGLTCYFAVYQS